MLALQAALSGCAAVVAVPVVVAAGAMSVYTIVNVARNQYPDINFDSQSPEEETYQASYDAVWTASMATLKEMKETTQMMDKSAGTIQTDRKNINDVKWFNRDLGQSVFFYEFNIAVKPVQGGVSVKSTVQFVEEKRFAENRQKDIPEGSNMMRHIFFRNLRNTLQEKA